MELRAGSRWKSAVCDTEIAIVKPPKEPFVLACGGRAVLAFKEPPSERGRMTTGHDGGTLLGKRYCDEPSGLEVLCTKAGAGSLSLEGRVLARKEAKALPSSD